MIQDEKNNAKEFKPENFWEAACDRPLNSGELEQINSSAKVFIKFMMEEELLQKRHKLQVEIYKIDCDLEDLVKNIFPVVDRAALIQKFESSLATLQSERKI